MDVTPVTFPSGVATRLTALSHPARPLFAGRSLDHSERNRNCGHERDLATGRTGGLSPTVVAGEDRGSARGRFHARRMRHDFGEVLELTFGPSRSLLRTLHARFSNSREPWEAEDRELERECAVVSRILGSHTVPTELRSRQGRCGLVRAETAPRCAREAAVFQRSAEAGGVRAHRGVAPGADVGTAALRP